MVDDRSTESLAAPLRLLPEGAAPLSGCQCPGYLVELSKHFWKQELPENHYQKATAF